jgi:hypothetical protein
LEYHGDIVAVTKFFAEPVRESFSENIVSFDQDPTASEIWALSKIEQFLFVSLAIQDQPWSLTI